MLMNPISPWHWSTTARRLARAEAWVPPMMIIAGGGLILVVSQLAFLTKTPVQHFAISILAWLTWLIVGAIATFIGTFESVRNLMRYGIDGPTRPRWWFEIARLLWTGFLLGLLSLPLGFLTLNILLYVIGEIVGTFALFFATASVAYLLTFRKGKPFRGRAFECVHFFYPSLGGICLLIYAASLWPPDDLLIGGTLIAVSGLLGISLLLFGFISNIIQSENHESR